MKQQEETYEGVMNVDFKPDADIDEFYKWFERTEALAQLSINPLKIEKIVSVLRSENESLFKAFFLKSIENARIDERERLIKSIHKISTDTNDTASNGIGGIGGVTS